MISTKNKARFFCIRRKIGTLRRQGRGGGRRSMSLRQKRNKQQKGISREGDALSLSKRAAPFPTAFCNKKRRNVKIFLDTRLALWYYKLLLCSVIVGEDTYPT